MSQLVVIIQCDQSLQRCPGFWCTHDFYLKTGCFEGYPADTRYMTMSCGGCCGHSVNAKLGRLSELLEREGTPKDEVVVHLASCIVSDNFHHGPCPFRPQIAALVKRQGYTVRAGSYISKRAQQKRDDRVYRPWDL
ncbi:MAG: CGGC domain-containing protein [Acidaminococcaceae bacterium]|nr:CGGC domain-containing protein [Acidaminococcaceae bacterium]